jgi:hypothetical protein
LLSGVTAALIPSSIALGTALGTGTRREVVIGSLIGSGRALATWFFITALRDELRRDRTTRDRNGKGTT